MPKKNDIPLLTAVIANDSEEIFELEGYAAVGMSGSAYRPLSVADALPMPYGGELMFLPDRDPVLYHVESRRLETLREHPLERGQKIHPVAAFNSPGYVISWVSAYREVGSPPPLPLFSYGAVGWHNGGFRSAVICVDKEKRQDLRYMSREKVISGIRKMRRKLPRNRLRAHLERCALTYGCPAAKNFFIGRYEAPLPTSRYCNAACAGCLSHQENGDIPVSQKRIDFTPSPEEIAEIALEHIERVQNSVVSFGQGCEGDPLLAAHVIEPAIRLIRSATSLGTINMNTNAGLPLVLDRLFDAGLDSVRVSINSVREDAYQSYFNPKSYRFSDVMQSIDTAIRKRRFLSLNYLNCPGVTDSPEEFHAFKTFLEQHAINMIQWRNLNFDPICYYKMMQRDFHREAPLGMQTLLHRIKKAFPKIKFGYFNPPKEKFNEMD